MVAIPRSLPELLKAEAPGLDEAHTATLHEPHLELRVTRQRTRLQRLYRSTHVVRAKDWLLEALLEHERER